MAAPAIALNGAWGARLRPQSFPVRSGDSRTVNVTIRDRNGSVVDVDGTYAWRMTNGPDARDGVKRSKSGTVTNGEFTVTLESNDTVAEDGRYYHEAEVTDGTGAVSVAMFGFIRVSDDVST